MNRVKFTTYYRDEENNNISYDFTEYILENEKLYICIERKYYLPNGEAEIIRGKALADDLMYGDNTEKFFGVYGELYSVRNHVEYCYKDEFFVEKIKWENYVSITIDDKEYKFRNPKLRDDDYDDLALYTFMYSMLINVPDKLLKQILSSKPFK